jgi:iron complex transport system substrate-binding protein
MLMKQLYRSCQLALMGIAASIWLSACVSLSPPLSSPQAIPSSVPCRPVLHERGTTDICGHPQRIAVLSPHILDLVLALGAQPAAYAESVPLDLEQFDNPTEQIPHLGKRISTQPVNLGDRRSPSLEKLSLLKPDLILGEDWLAGNYYSLLSHIAPTLLFTDDRDGTQHWRNSIDGVAKALGREEAINKLNSEVLQQLEATRVALAPVVEALPKVLVLSVNSSMTDVAIAADSTVGSLLEDLGFQLVFPQPTIAGEVRWLQASPEVIPTLEADIAIVIGWDASDFYSQESKLKANWHRTPMLQDIPAAKANRIFFVDYQLWGSITRGPITDMLILQKLPELFSPLLSS